MTIEHLATVTPHGHGLGWRGTDTANWPTQKYVPSQAALMALPAATDNLGKHPTWLLNMANQDQRNEGSCTAWAAKHLTYWAYNQAGWHNPFEPSARAIYYAERQILEGAQYGLTNATKLDTGGFSRAVIEGTVKYGITAETNCPYAPDGNPLDYVATAPDALTYVNMSHHLDVLPQQIVHDRAHMQAALAAGHPFIFGFTLYASFETEAVRATGFVPMPAIGEQVLGGHEMCCFDYKMINGRLYYVALGSWGTWGDHGRCYFPATYFEDQYSIADLWTILKQF